MDLVKQLCQASTTLAKTFPVEERQVKPRWWVGRRLLTQWQLF